MNLIPQRQLIATTGRATKPTNQCIEKRNIVIATLAVPTAIIKKGGMKPLNSLLNSILVSFIISFKLLFMVLENKKPGHSFDVPG